SSSITSTSMNMSDSHPDNHSARHGGELDPRLFEDVGRILDEPDSANDAVNEFTVDDVASRSHADRLDQGSSFESLEMLDQGVLAQLASHLSMPPAASSGVPDDAGEFTMPAAMPAGLPVDAVDLRQLLSDQTAPSLQPVSNSGMPAQMFAPPQPATGFGMPATTRHEEFDVPTIRNDFPILHQEIHGKPLIWFDNAATTQKPQSVIDAISNFYQRDNSNVHRGAHSLAARSTDAYEQARDKVRQFIGASSSEEIVFVRGTTEGINLVAQTFGRQNIGTGDEILLTTMEHHANIVPWQMLAEETGAVIREAPITGRGELDLERFGNLLGPKTRLVAFTQVSNALGTVLPVKEMVTMARRFDTRVLVDGAQSVPHMPVNVQEMDADFFVFSGHKLFAPTGVGVVYGKKELLETIPPWQGGGNMIESVSFEKTTYTGPPTKFEAGTGTLADAVGLGAAIDYLNSIGMDRIASYERTLTEYAMGRLAEVPGLRLIGTAPEKASVLSFVMDGLQPEDVARRLDLEGIAVRAGHHCAQPTMQRYGLTGTVRPSLAFYNTHDEIDRMIQALMQIGV
ncbi:MAG: SufS family cysteine desulfurase, partial [Pirellulaceae bacterium]